MEDNKTYSLRSLVSEITGNTDTSSSTFESDYNAIRKIYKRINRYLGIVDAETKFTDNTKTHYIEAIKLLLDKENGYSILLKQINKRRKSQINSSENDNVTGVEKELPEKSSKNDNKIKRIAKETELTDKLNSIFYPKPQVLNEVNKRYEDIANATHDSFIFLHTKLLSSRIKEATKSNIFLPILKEIMRGINTFEKEQASLPDESVLKMKSERTAQNPRLDSKKLSDLVISILDNIDNYPEDTTEINDEEKYILKYLPKLDFEEAIHIHEDIKNNNKSYKSISSISIQDLFRRAYPTKVSEENNQLLQMYKKETENS